MKLNVNAADTAGGLLTSTNEHPSSTLDRAIHFAARQPGDHPTYIFNRMNASFQNPHLLLLSC